jgi:hypothetical protein
MDKQQARNLIKETFERPFEKERFVAFVKNLLNRYEEAPFTYKGQFIPDAYKPYISALERIGKFSDGEHAIDILVIRLKKETSLERARTRQRNFVAWYLNGSRGDKLRDAALVAFISPDETDWRFSLVKMDYKFEETKTGKMKVQEEFTPARRWSFLVGVGEKSHTAQSRLVNILADDEQSPTLAELEKAFDIETVTREFFLKYRNLFIRTKEALDEVVESDRKIKTDFEAKHVNTVDFAKKLLGQIVFLYFLQKKGWFGVGRDTAWGTGSKQFLRELFEGNHGSYTNFFEDILEPLFYEALRTDRSYDDDYYSRFKCKIPFLNGGLFDPISDYDWVHTEIALPNNLFSNKKRTPEGDIGDGILDVFDRYNFTVKEDEPLEKEVAIDPELLGKAYEKFNAIRPDNFGEYKKALSGKKGDESKFNKQFGVYYTHREIVHYMCQQSLINYLHTELNQGVVAYEKLGAKQYNMFGNKGKKGQLDLTVEHKSNPTIPKEDIEKLIHLGEQVSANDARVENNGKETSTYSYKLSESIRKNAGLIDRKLADITVCDPAVGSGAFPVGMMSEIVRTRNVLSTFIQDEKRTPYNFKRRCIEHSLYGVDIDSGAVEIAKLRLWLSLVVDENDIKNIKPLPNLDYKIVCGNSLLGYPYTPMGLDEIEKLKELFIYEAKPTRKHELRSRIDRAIYGLFENSAKSLGYQVSMDFKVNFSEVFHEKGGFDVVIGNPPYVRADEQSAWNRFQREQILASKSYETLWEKWDLFVPFIEKGYKLLKSGGVTTLIVSDAFCHSKYAQKPQKWFLQHARILRLDFCSDLQMFDAAVHNLIYFFQRADGTRNVPERRVHVETFGNVVTLPSDQQAKLTYRAFFPETKAVQALACKTLRLDEVCYVSVGMVVNADEKEAKGAFELRDLLSSVRDKTHPKPFVEGKDVVRWLPATTKWIEWGTQRAPTLFRRKTFPELYEQTGKLLLVKVGEVRCAYDDDSLYTNEGIYMGVPWHALKGVRNNSLKKAARYIGEKPPRPDLPKREELEATSRRFSIKYLLGVMNSAVARDFLRANRRNNVQLYPDDWKMLPIPDIDTAAQAPIVKLVDRILSVKAVDLTSDISALEREIDRMVCELYGLTEDEIKIVEGGDENAR